MEALQDGLSGASILHIAAHGIADQEEPLRKSFLALAGYGVLDSRFSALEVLDRDLGGLDLAIMSACQSDLGFQYEQGVIGLARAFYFAGVPSVLMSLWNVDDAATNLLMTTFHQNLKKSAPPEALRSAVLLTREKYPEPSKWASFSLFGNSD